MILFPEETAEALLKPRLDDMDVAPMAESSEDLYRPPQLAPTTFNESDSVATKRARAEERERKRAQQSEMAQMLKENYTDAAVEVTQDYATDGSKQMRRYQEHQADRTRFEEENMVRLAQTKEDRKFRKKTQRVINPDVDALLNDESVMGGFGRGSSEAANREMLEKQQALQAAMGSIRAQNKAALKGLDKPNNNKPKPKTFAAKPKSPGGQGKPNGGQKAQQAEPKGKKRGRDDKAGTTAKRARSRK
eukprot:c5792_g1_i2.p1 GENE.c5792_g1_i2~~c5792_g1_i2.p1  ORF type:complete len:248 (+),score=69.13 c5792_g1_i2:435-1178(+)